MDTRIALRAGTVLKCPDSGLTYVIQDEIARGGSCIVYDAIYRTGECIEKPVRLKECYPFQLNIQRAESGELLPAEGEHENFEKAKRSMRRAFREGNGLFLTKGLTNAMSNMLHCFDRNHTVYIPSAYLEGETLTHQTFSSLKDCINIVRAVSLVVERIHKAGYLYLDLKPGNVFVITNVEGKGATELVQLFDFDSLLEVESLKRGDSEEFRLSYTQGFAALEHQMGQFHKIGFHTDVYSTGALLFYLIFGVSPRAEDCEADSSYRLEASRYGNDGYQDLLFQKMTEFFHRTLANYPPDRYQAMGEAAEQLESLAFLSDTAIPYVFSTSVAPNRCFVGREKELAALQCWLDREDGGKCLFLTGMGGIGKSALAQRFLSINAGLCDTALYLYFQDSLQSTLIDDNGLSINTVAQGKEENDSDYFKRKLRTLKKLLQNKKALLAIDNFHGELTEEFHEALNVGWKVLIISRANPPSERYAHISLGALQDRARLRQLFEAHASLRPTEEEKICLDHMFESVAGHTLTIELIAKQIRKSRLTIARAAALADELGFSGIAPEKVMFERDRRTKHETVRQIISAVFSCQEQSLEKRTLLKALSLFPQTGVGEHMFCKMLKLPSKDSINELFEEGWLHVSDGTLSMHPVIREAVDGWEWERGCQKDAMHIMKHLLHRLKLEAERDDAKILVQLSESVLGRCAKVRALREADAWAELSIHTLLHMPTDREDYIVRHGETLLKVMESLEPICKNKPLTMLFFRNEPLTMRFFRKLLSVYLEQRSFPAAWELLGKIKKYAHARSHYAKGEHYDMLSDFYDARLDGQYESDNEHRDLARLLRSMDQAIFHMGLAAGGQKERLLIRYMLNKANVLIRSAPETGKISMRARAHQIRHLLHQAKDAIAKNAPCDQELRWQYDMSAAWFYCLEEPDETQVDRFCRHADGIVSKTCATDLEYIDIILIPCANMMAELGNLEKTKKLLAEGIARCEKYPEMLPYGRKKEDLEGYLREVRISFFATTNPEDGKGGV